MGVKEARMSGTQCPASLSKRCGLLECIEMLLVRSFIGNVRPVMHPAPLYPENAICSRWHRAGMCGAGRNRGGGLGGVDMFTIEDSLFGRRRSFSCQSLSLSVAEMVAQSSIVSAKEVLSKESVFLMVS